MYSSLEELKHAFYTDSSVSSRELLWSMEEVVLGTSELKQHWGAELANPDSFTPNNDALYKTIALKSPTLTFEERYPNLSGQVDVVNYDTQTPKEWDIAFYENDSGIRFPALYVYLDGEFKRRCESGDDIVVIYGKDAEQSNRGYRLKNV